MSGLTLIACDGFAQKEGHRRGTYWDFPCMSKLRAAATARGHRVVFPEYGANWNKRKALKMARAMEAEHGLHVYLGFSDGGQAAMHAAFHTHSPFVAYGIAAWRAAVPRDPLPGLFVASSKDHLTRDHTYDTYVKFVGAWGQWVDWYEHPDRRRTVKKKLHRHYWLPGANEIILNWCERAAGPWYDYRRKTDK